MTSFAIFRSDISLMSCSFLRDVLFFFFGYKIFGDTRPNDFVFGGHQSPLERIQKVFKDTIDFFGSQMGSHYFFFFEKKKGS